MAAITLFHGSWNNALERAARSAAFRKNGRPAYHPSANMHHRLRNNRAPSPAGRCSDRAARPPFRGVDAGVSSPVRAPAGCGGAERSRASISRSNWRASSAPSNAISLPPLLLRPFEAAARKRRFGHWPVEIFDGATSAVGMARGRGPIHRFPTVQLVRLVARSSWICKSPASCSAISWPVGRRPLSISGKRLRSSSSEVPVPTGTAGAGSAISGTASVGIAGRGAIRGRPLAMRRYNSNMP